LSLPSSFSPLVTTIFFSMNGSPFLFCIIFICIFFISHISGSISCLFSSVWLIHEVWYSLGPSMLVQMAVFHSFNSWVFYTHTHTYTYTHPYMQSTGLQTLGHDQWQNNNNSISTASSWPTYLLFGTRFPSVSWLLYVVLLWTYVCMCNLN